MFKLRLSPSMFSEALDTKRKALKINLDDQIYGSFAEIGAGQEVARNFFKAGAASGTIAKTMSAYDMAFSNAIYGLEENGRYVSRSRLIKMLSHEFDLMLERLVDQRYANKTFFAFANTVTTLNYSKNNDPNGWIGIRFQLYPGTHANQLLFHVRLLDTDSNLQQQILGTLGVNLIYAAFFYRDDYRQMIESLADNISPGSVDIDLIDVRGDDFKNIDNRLLNLYLITKGFSSSAIFTSDGLIHHPKDYLYKKNLLILRTRVHQHTLHASKIKQAALTYFEDECESSANVLYVNEIALEKTFNEASGAGDFKSMIARIEELTESGEVVMVSNFERHHNLAQYTRRFKPERVRIIVGTRSLTNIFNAAHYGSDYTTELLGYISNLFGKEVRLYVYPETNRSGIWMPLSSIPVSDEASFLFQFLIQNKYLHEIAKDFSE